MRLPAMHSSDPARLAEGFEFAADELRPALRVTRRVGENRLSLVFDVCERLPRVWEMWSEGLIDLARARVVCNGTALLDGVEARGVVDEIAARAPRLTTGQLAAWIRRLCVESDPEKAKKRSEHARSERRLVVEATSDGTGNVHLLDVDIADAKAIGKRVNAHMISHRRDGTYGPTTILEPISPGTCSWVPTGSGGFESVDDHSRRPGPPRRPRSPAWVR